MLLSPSFVVFGVAYVEEFSFFSFNVWVVIVVVLIVFVVFVVVFIAEFILSVVELVANASTSLSLHPCPGFSVLGQQIL